MSAVVIRFPRPFAPRVTSTWRPTRGEFADWAGHRVTVLLVEPNTTLVLYEDGEGSWEQRVGTRQLRPWRGDNALPCDVEQPDPPTPGAA